jgi:hypothetical protein
VQAGELRLREIMFDQTGFSKSPAQLEHGPMRTPLPAGNRREGKAGCDIHND